jgi:hypothetical protein
MLQKKAPDVLKSLDAEMESPHLEGSPRPDRWFGGSKNFSACKPLKFPKTGSASRCFKSGKKPGAPVDAVADRVGPVCRHSENEPLYDGGAQRARLQPRGSPSRAKTSSLVSIDFAVHINLQQ